MGEYTPVLNEISSALKRIATTLEEMARDRRYEAAEKRGRKEK